MSNNDIYKAIGSLESSVKTLVDGQTQIFGALVEIKNCNSAYHVRVDRAIGPSNDPEPITAQGIKTAIESGEDWQESKKRVKWTLMGFLGAGIAGGTYIGSWLTKIAGLFGAPS